MGGKSQMARNYVYVSYGLECQNPQKAPKGSKRYSVPKIKDRQYLQIICEGKATGNEIMSMFSTEIAAESNT